MPASAVLVPVVPPAVPLPEHVTMVRSGRGCPACLDSQCFNPAECLHFLTAYPWSDCDMCDGCGWADEGSASLFCEICAGSGLVEHSCNSITPDEISDHAKARHATHVTRLRARVGSVAVTA
ncbi:hypothetical protein [Streptomyces sp. NPDC059943]|uniref:hypothetical protein n=1 Tax=Streptomyces sp. NPDC059943 TaxID=3347010 RepID=UPI003658CCED